MQILKLVSQRTLIFILAILLLINILLLIFLLNLPRNIVVKNHSSYLILEYNEKSDRQFSSCFNKDLLLNGITISFSDLDKQNPPKDYKNNGIFVKSEKRNLGRDITIYQDILPTASEKDFSTINESLNVIVFGQVVSALNSIITKEESICLQHKLKEVQNNSNLSPFSLKIIKK